MNTNPKRENWGENDKPTFHGLVSHGSQGLWETSLKKQITWTPTHVTLTISERKIVFLWKPCRPFGFWLVVQPFIFRVGDPIIGGWVGFLQRRPRNGRYTWVKWGPNKWPKINGFTIAWGYFTPNNCWLWVHPVFKNIADLGLTS